MVECRDVLRVLRLSGQEMVEMLEALAAGLNSLGLLGRLNEKSFLILSSIQHVRKNNTHNVSKECNIRRLA